LYLHIFNWAKTRRIPDSKMSVLRTTESLAGIKLERYSNGYIELRHNSKAKIEWV